MKLTAYLCTAALIGVSGVAAAANEKTQLCYPKDNERAKFCQDIFYDPDALPFSLFSQGEIENGLSNVTKYGLELTKIVENPLLKKAADRIAESVAAAGYGPMLALARLALSSRLNGGTQPDPIEVAVKVILNRIEEAESRIIGRIDEQYRQEAIDQFNGLNTLHQIYNTADTLEKRATAGYRSRLYQVDNNLDTLLEYFENGRFRNEHVKNFQIYLQLVSLRLAVLAEVERLALYDLYGSDLDPHYAEYESTLKLQYQIVLDGVFDYVNSTVAESSEWRVESDKRFGGFQFGQSFHSGATSPRWPTGVVSYSNTIRPVLYPAEQAYYDGNVVVRSPRGGTTSWKLGNYMTLQEVKYSFSGLDYGLHLTRSSTQGSAPYHYYGGSIFDGERFEKSYSCNNSPRTGQYCPDGLWFDATKNFANSVVAHHKERGYKQFVYIYYYPTQKILDQWWSMYHEAGDLRPKNKLDMMVDQML